MEVLNKMLAAGLMITLAGCATSSQVQEMIDASQQDFLQKSEENAASIDVLKQTAKASLEKDGEHVAIMEELQKQLTAAAAALESVSTTAEATKLLSASSVVKIAEMQEAIDGNKTVMDVYIEKMRENDELYEKVLIEHFQQLADSANALLAALQAASEPAAVEPPIQRDPIPVAEPIEIIAPDTSSATNSAPAQ